MLYILCVPCLKIKWTQHISDLTNIKEFSKFLLLILLTIYTSPELTFLLNSHTASHMGLFEYRHSKSPISGEVMGIFK